MNEDKPKTRLIPLSHWSKYHPWPSVYALRNMLFYSKTNGFYKVVKRVGARVLIDEVEFFKWVDEMNEKSKREIGG